MYEAEIQQSDELSGLMAVPCPSCNLPLGARGERDSGMPSRSHRQTQRNSEMGVEQRDCEDSHRGRLEVLRALSWDWNLHSVAQTTTIR